MTLRNTKCLSACGFSLVCAGRTQHPMSHKIADAPNARTSVSDRTWEHTRLPSRSATASQPLRTGREGATTSCSTASLRLLRDEGSLVISDFGGRCGERRRCSMGEEPPGAGSDDGDGAGAFGVDGDASPS